MCSPLLAVGLGMQATGAYLGAENAKQEAKRENLKAEYNAILAERNADLLEKDAVWALKKGKVDANLIKRDVRSMVGSQRSSFGASGAVVDSGSTHETIVDTEVLGALDVLTVERNAARKAWSLRQEAHSNRLQAQMYRTGKYDPDKVFMTSLLGGALDVGGGALTAYGMQKSRYGS